MRKRLLRSLLISCLPLIYMAKLNVSSTLFTAAAVIISILVTEFTRSRISSQSTSGELHQKISKSVKSLIERDLESELFNLSSQVEQEIKTNLQGIDATADLAQKFRNFAVITPVLMFLLNALFLFYMSKELALLNKEEILAMSAMMLLAHLGSITPTDFRRNS